MLLLFACFVAEHVPDATVVAGGVELGAAVAIGDVDGDGVGELIASADVTVGDRFGDVYVFGTLPSGEADGTSASTVIRASVEGSGFGRRLFVSDGQVAVAGADGPAESSVGGVWVYRTLLAGEQPQGFADEVYLGSAAGDEAGASFAQADVDGDGVVDVLLGAPAVGGVYLFGG